MQKITEEELGKKCQMGANFSIARPHPGGQLDTDTIVIFASVEHLVGAIVNPARRVNIRAKTRLIEKFGRPMQPRESDVSGLVLVELVWVRLQHYAKTRESICRYDSIGR
jgi:hypothetical protein